MTSLSVILITYNEAPLIESCLDSVAWADEIVVVDSESSDETVELCRRYTDRVYRQPWQGYGPQKQQALAYARGPWILNIDADEQVSEPLAQEIQGLLQNPDPPQAAGYHIPRLSYFLGRPIRHCGWGGDRPLRLFRKDQARVTKTQVHEGFFVDGRVDNLNNPIFHNTCRTLYQYLEKLNECTSLEVRNRLRQNPNRCIHWYHLTLSPVATFWKLYIAKQGFRDGFHGLILSLLSAVSVFVGYAKIWEYQRRRREGRGLFPPIRVEELGRLPAGYNRLHRGGDEEFPVNTR